MNKKSSTLRVRCSCCDAVLTVDGSSGEVLSAERTHKKNLSFEDALLQLEKEKESADDRFRDAFAQEASRKKSAEGKFEEALKHADELEDPIRPLDFD